MVTACPDYPDLTALKEAIRRVDNLVHEIYIRTNSDAEDVHDFREIRSHLEGVYFILRRLVPFAGYAGALDIDYFSHDSSLLTESAFCHYVATWLFDQLGSHPNRDGSTWVTRYGSNAARAEAAYAACCGQVRAAMPVELADKCIALYDAGTHDT